MANRKPDPEKIYGGLYDIPETDAGWDELEGSLLAERIKLQDILRDLNYEGSTDYERMSALRSMINRIKTALHDLAEIRDKQRQQREREALASNRLLPAKGAR